MTEIVEKREWRRFSALLCSFGLFISIRPSEPYLTPYLMGPHQNLTESDLIHNIYPTWTYAYLVLLFPIFLITDYTRYKPIIIVHALGYVLCYVILVFGKGIVLMKLMQVVFAFATAGEVGYYSYPYNVLHQKYFQKVTSYTRSCCLLGSFFGSIIAQFLVSFAAIDVFYLHVITLCNCSIALVLCLFFPMPSRSLFYVDQHRVKKHGVDEELTNMTEVASVETSMEHKISEVGERKSHKQVLHELWKHAVECYSDKYLMRWSIYMVLTMSGWLFVVGYIQTLWEVIVPDGKYATYNGAVESVATILGAISAFLVSLIKVDWLRWGEFSFAFCSLLKCGLVCWMAITNDIITCYCCYSAYIFLLNFVITIIQFQLASGLTSQRHALVFGVNTFIAVGVNTLGTVILLEQSFLNVHMRTFFIIISGYFGVTALFFFVYGFFCWCKKSSSEIQSSSVVATANLS